MLMLLGEAYDKANELHAARVPDQMTSATCPGSVSSCAGSGASYSIAYHGISHAHDAREGARGMALLCPGSRP